MARGVFIGIGAFLVILIGAFFVFRRPAADVPSKLTLTVWSPFDEGKIYQDISKPFLSNNPNTNLEFKYIEASDAKDYEAKVVDAIANGKGPDIWLVRSDWLPKHLDKSQPASGTAKADPITFAKASLIESIVDLNTIDSKLYGLPLFGDSLAVIYNTSLYDPIIEALPADQQTIAQKTPASWDDLKQEAAFISQTKNNLVTRSAIALGTNGNTLLPSDVLSAFLLQSGATVLSDDQKDVNFNVASIKNGVASFPASEALDFYTSFAKPGQKNYSWSTNLGDPLNAFLNQKTGALIGYYSTLQTIVQKNPSFTIKVAPLVQKDPENRVDFAVSWSHVVNKQSPQTDAAWSYLGYLLGRDVMSSYNTQAKHLSVGKLALNATADLQPIATAEGVFYGQFATAKAFTKPEWQFTDEVLQDSIRLIIDNGQTPQVAVDTAASRFKAFLGR